MQTLPAPPFTVFVRPGPGDPMGLLLCDDMPISLFDLDHMRVEIFPSSRAVTEGGEYVGHEPCTGWRIKLLLNGKWFAIYENAYEPVLVLDVAGDRSRPWLASCWQRLVDQVKRPA